MRCGHFEPLGSSASAAFALSHGGTNGLVMGEVLDSLWCSIFLLYAVLVSLMPFFRPSLATLPQHYLDFHSQPGFVVRSNPGDVCQRSSQNLM